jgi:hypothetical protein
MKPARKRRRIEDKQPLKVVASEPSLALIPDNVALRIMTLLDIHSLLRLSQVNKRYYLLHSDECIWTDVDLSTVAWSDVRIVKKVIRDKLHPALWRLTLRSNAVECQRKPKLRPIMTSSALDDIFRKCPHIRIIRLHNFDISQLPEGCLLWSSRYLERVTFSHCIAPFRWLEKVKPHWPRVSHLYLPYTNKTSDHDLAYLATLKDSGGWSTSLRHLSVKNCYRIEKIGVNVLCISFSNLLTLDISECSNMTPDCLTLIAKHMTQLQHLNIANCAHMESVESADELLSSLQANCTHLKYLTVSAAQLHLDEDPDSERNSTRLKYLTFKIQ